MTILKPKENLSYQPVRYTSPSISNGCEPAPEATLVVPIFEDCGQVPASAAGSPHKGTLDSKPQQPRRRVHLDTLHVLFAIASREVHRERTELTGLRRDGARDKAWAEALEGLRIPTP